jgi:methanogenic corrinoid protein MtbC1
MKVNVDEFRERLISLDKAGSLELIKEEFEPIAGTEWIKELIVPSLERIGKDWSEGKLSLAQVYMTGKIAEKLVDDLLFKASEPRKDQPNMAICALEDHHLLGKRIVYSILRSAGYKLQDFGQITAKDLIIKLKDSDIEFLLISTLMLPSALKVKEVVDAMKNTNIKVIVGGAPFRLDEELWKEVGAYGVCMDASEILDVLEEVRQ